MTTQYKTAGATASRATYVVVETIHPRVEPGDVYNPGFVMPTSYVRWHCYGCNDSNEFHVERAGQLPDAERTAKKEGLAHADSCRL